MPGDPRQCRLNAARCLALAKRVRKPEADKVFTEMADVEPIGRRNGMRPDAGPGDF